MEDLIDRILYRQAIETARCYEEKILVSSAEANVGSILGIGFPSWTGGALQFINSIGASAFVKRADELAAQYGPRFNVPAELREMAVQQGRYE